MIVALAFSCLVLAQAAPAPAAPAADPALARKVGLLVRQLDADTADARAAAEEGLLALGPPVLALLPPEANASAQVKAALARIRGTLQKAAAERASKGSRVTLSLADQPFSEALKLITQQTKNGFTDLRENRGEEKTDPKVTLDVKDAPFWEAVDKLFDAGGLNVSHYGVGEEEGVAGRSFVGIVGKSPRDLPRFGRAAYVGAFRIEGVRLDLARDLRTRGAHVLKLNVETTWEPQLRPVALDLPLSNVTAVDEKGEPIEVDGREGTVTSEVHSGVRAVEFDIPLAAPGREVRQIASLKGKMTVLIPGEINTFRFALPKKGARKPMFPIEQRVGDVVVSLVDVDKNVDVQQVIIKVRFDDAKEALQSHRSAWMDDNEAYIEGADGKPIRWGGFEKIEEREGVGYAYLFPAEQELDGLAFVYKTPSTIVEMPVEFELKGMELP